MYTAKFVSDKGKTFSLGSGNVFDIDGLSGLSVDLGIVQGFSQIGDTVQTQAVGGKPMTITGRIYTDIRNQKRLLQNAFAPFTAGTLFFQGEYFIDCVVSDAPTVSPLKDDGSFMLRLYCPYPFFRRIAESTFYIGKITPMFSFPVDFSTPHVFGQKAKERYVNVYNDGDVKTPYRLEVSTEATSTNVTITNIETRQMLKITGAITAGQTVVCYRDNQNIFRAELVEGGKVTDIISRIDRKSNLFELAVGDNMILADDSEGGASLTAQISFYSPVSGVSE